MNTTKKPILFLIFFFLTSIKLFATTWNEPWADKVIKQADFFILAHITSHNEEKGVKLRIIKQLGGEPLPKDLEVTNFYSLNIMSSSGGHGAEFHFKDSSKCYFFIKKNSSGEFCISTPTSGFDYILENNVAATYRHSYHQALVPIEIYEMTMTAIYNSYHNLSYDKRRVLEFIDNTLVKKPAGFGEKEINTFFLQHVALETIFHLRLDKYYQLILPFFNDDSNFHHRVSASRALIAYKNPETIKLLLNKVMKNKEDDFVTVICLWTLKEFKPKEIKDQLNELARSASSEDNGFGGDIMDPRVGTDFPTVKEAIEDLISTL